MKKLYAALVVGLFMFVFEAQAQTITINTPTFGQQVPSGSYIVVNFSNPSKLIYGVSYLYKGATLITTLTSTDYPNTNYLISSSGLALGTDYRVKVYDAGNPSNLRWSDYFSIVTVPAPLATAATSIGEVTFTANWNAVSGATDYRLDISTVSDFSSFVTGFQDKSTASMTGGTTSKAIYGDFYPGQTYYLRLRATNASGTSANSNTITVLMKPPAPIASGATNITATSFTANWNSSLSATEYRLDVSADNFSTFVSGYNNLMVSGLSQSVTGLTAGGTYAYRVRAVNATATSNNATSSSIDLLSVTFPANGAFVRQCESYTIRYKGAINSPRAEVHLNNASGPLVQTLGVPPNTIAVNTDNVISASTLTVGNNYQIKVYEDGNPSNYALSGIFTVGTIPAPSSIELIANTYTMIEFGWTNVYGATSYGVDVATSSNFSTGIIWNNQIKYPYEASNVYVTGLSGGTTIYVRVRSIGSCGTSNNTSVYNWTTPICASISTPTANSATNVQVCSFTANWSSVAAATSGYDVSVTLGATTTVYSAASGATSMNITSPPNTSYSYKVRGKSTCTTSSYSNIVTGSTPVLSAPTLSGGGGDSHSRWRGWTAVTGATEYEFQTATDEDFEHIIETFHPTGTSQTFAAEWCQEIHLRVRAKCAGGSFSAWTAELWPAGAGCEGRLAQNIEDKSAPSSNTNDADASLEILNMTTSPNPVETILRVNLPSKLNKERLAFSFTDMTGRTMTPSAQLFQGYAEIEVKPIPSGVYILSVTDGVSIHRAKILRK